MKKPKFTQIAPNEIRIDYRGHKFMLVERTRGVYGIGRAIQLYLLEGFDKKHIKEIGWTRSDNHGCRGIREAAITDHFTTMDKCKVAAVNYIDSVM
jgi:hypothetical protein